MPFSGKSFAQPQTLLELSRKLCTRHTGVRSTLGFIVSRLAFISDKEHDHNICCVHDQPRGCRVLTLTVPNYFSADNLTTRVCFSMACTARSVRPFHLLSARCQPPCVSFGAPNWVTANSEGLSLKLQTYHQLHQDTPLHHHHDLALTLI